MNGTQHEEKWWSANFATWLGAAGKVSVWLKAGIPGAGVLYLAISYAIWRHQSVGTFGEFLLAVGSDRSSTRIGAELLVAIPLQAGLFWFTYLSKSRLVSADDKRSVALMFAGAAVAYVGLMMRHI